MASGHPDWYDGSVLYGIFNNLPKAIAVDTAGFLTAVLKALYAGQLQTLACDVDGNLKINLVSQILDVVKMKPYYGVKKYYEFTEDNAFPSPRTLINIATAANIISFTYTQDMFEDRSFVDDRLIITIDGVTSYDITLAEIMSLSTPVYGERLWLVTTYDTVDRIFAVTFTGVIECISSFLIEHYNTYSNRSKRSILVSYALP